MIFYMASEHFEFHHDSPLLQLWENIGLGSKRLEELAEL
jgi:hypothetical protein